MASQTSTSAKSCVVLWLLLCASALLSVPAGWAQNLSKLDVAIMEAPAFLDPILWVGDSPPLAKDSADLWAALEIFRQEGVKGGFPVLEAYIQEHPTSAWTPSLRANLGDYYYEHARPTPALQHWEAAWDACRDLKDANGMQVADFVLANWSLALATHSQLAALELLVKESEGRELDGGRLRQMYRQATQKLAVLRKQPESPGSAASFLAAPPQSRTSGFPASGSSSHGFAP